MICIFRIKPKVELTKSNLYIICSLVLNLHSSTSQLNHTNEEIPSDYWGNLQTRKQEDQSIPARGISQSPQPRGLADLSRCEVEAQDHVHRERHHAGDHHHDGGHTDGDALEVPGFFQYPPFLLSGF